MLTPLQPLAPTSGDAPAASSFADFKHSLGSILYKMSGPDGTVKPSTGSSSNSWFGIPVYNLLSVIVGLVFLAGGLFLLPKVQEATGAVAKAAVAAA